MSSGDYDRLRPLPAGMRAATASEIASLTGAKEATQGWRSGEENERALRLAFASRSTTVQLNGKPFRVEYYPDGPGGKQKGPWAFVRSQSGFAPCGWFDLTLYRPHS